MSATNFVRVVAVAFFALCLSLSAPIAQATGSVPEGCSAPEGGGITNCGVYAHVIVKYKDKAKSWASVMTRRATYLFWSLAVISLAWTAGQWIFQKPDGQMLLAEIVKFLMVTGFFWSLLFFGPQIATAIVSSMEKIGAEAAGVSVGLDPGSIVDIGFDIFFGTIDKAELSLVFVAGTLISLALLIIMALIAANMLLLIITSWILLYGGVFLLGFGGGRWTSDIAINYYKTVLGVGLSLMGMLLVVSIGSGIMQDYYKDMSEGMQVKQLAVILIVGIILFILTNKIPSMIAGIITGASIGSAPTMGGFGGGAAVGAMGMAGAAVATGGAAMLEAGKSAAGGLSAVGAAITQAQQHMQTGTGLFTGTGGAPGLASAAMAAASTGGASAFAQAMGVGSTFIADAAVNLMKGMGSVAENAAEKNSEKLDNAIGGTVGGKIAAAIAAMDEPKTPKPAGGGEESSGLSGSIGPGDREPSAPSADEFDSFINKKE